jgi:hypothetical protein
MADQSSTGPTTAEARQEWDLLYKKMKGRLPPLKRASYSVPPTVTAHKQQPEVVRSVTPVPKAPIAQVVSQQPALQEKPTVTPVQQTEVISNQPIQRKEGFMVKDPVVRMIAILVIGLAAMTVIDWHKDWSANKRNARELADAQSEKDIAEIKASTPGVEKKVPVASVVVSTAPVYNCNSPESVQAGFRQRKVHSLGEVSGTPITGCMLLSIGNTSDGPVAFSGSNYVIELPVNPASASYDDQSSYYRCPTSENPSCSEFFAKARNYPIYQNKAARILTMVDGSVTITQTNQGESYVR